MCDNGNMLSLMRWQWRSQKFVMEGVQNRGHIGSGRWGSEERACPSRKIFDILVIATLNFAEFAWLNLIFIARQNNKPTFM